MANDYARLLIDLEANTAKFTKPMQDAANRLNSFQSGIKSMARTLGGIFAVGAIVNYANKVAEAADTQNKLAKRLGITKIEADALELSLTKGGMSLGEAQKTFDVFNQKLGELAQGESLATEAFNRLGLDAKAMQGKNLAQSLMEVNRRMAEFSTQERAAMAKDLFGKGGRKIGERLTDYESNLRSIEEITQRLGITDAGITSIEEMNDQFTTTKKTLELITTSVLVDLAPHINDAAIAAGKLALEFGRIADFRLAAGAASEMAGGGIKGWWAAMQQSLDETSIKETLNKWESYKAELSKGRPSPRGGEWQLPTNLAQDVARGEAEALKKTSEASDDLEESTSEVLTETEKYIAKVKEGAIPAIDKLRESFNLLEDATGKGLLTNVEKISGMAAAWKQYKDALPDSTDLQPIVEMQLQMERLQKQFESGGIDRPPYEAQMQALQEQLAGAQAEQSGKAGFVEYLKNMFTGLKQNQEALEQFNADYQSFADQVMQETQSPFEKYMEYVGKLDTVLQAGMITANAYWKALSGAWADFQNSAGMQYMQQMTENVMRMGQIVPSSGMQIMDIGASRYQTPGMAASMSASEAASMMGGGLADISKQQLTTQKSISAGINQMVFLLSRGLI